MFDLVLVIVKVFFICIFFTSNGRLRVVLLGIVRGGFLGLFLLCEGNDGNIF